MRRGERGEEENTGRTDAQTHRLVLPTEHMNSHIQKTLNSTSLSRISSSRNSHALIITHTFSFGCGCAHVMLRNKAYTDCPSASNTQDLVSKTAKRHI